MNGPGLWKPSAGIHDETQGKVFMRNALVQWSVAGCTRLDFVVVDPAASGIG